MGRIVTPMPEWGELAALLARGFLRLTQKRRNSAVFRPTEPQIPLELAAKPSTPVYRETPTWKRAS